MKKFYGAFCALGSRLNGKWLLTDLKRFRGQSFRCVFSYLFHAFDVFYAFSFGRAVLYNVFMAFFLPETLVKTLAKNLIKNCPKTVRKTG